jgi:hypothetical protein
LNGSHDISACITKLSCKDFGTPKSKFFLHGKILAL